MTDPLPQPHLILSHPVRSADVAGRREVHFAITADATARAQIAALVDATVVDRLAFTGVLRPEGRRDVVLEGRLSGHVVQACIITLAPVPTKVEAEVRRVYRAGLEMPEAGEVEMPEDDTEEPLPEVIDLGAVMVEALALELPDYPRAPGAELGSLTVAEPGVEPLSDDALRPFAALGKLKALVARPGSDDPGDTGGDGGGDGGGD